MSDALEVQSNVSAQEGTVPDAFNKLCRMIKKKATEDVQNWFKEPANKVIKKEVLKAFDSRGETLLHRAAHEANDANVDLLLVFLRKKADPSVKSRHRSQQTPLHIAASLGHQKACEELVRYNADLTARDERSRTPEEAARHFNFVGLAQYLKMEAADRNLDQSMLKGASVNTANGRPTLTSAALTSPSRMVHTPRTQEEQAIAESRAGSEGGHTNANNQQDAAGGGGMLSLQSVQQLQALREQLNAMETQFSEQKLKTDELQSAKSALTMQLERQGEKTRAQEAQCQSLTNQVTMLEAELEATQRKLVDEENKSKKLSGENGEMKQQLSNKQEMAAQLNRTQTEALESRQLCDDLKAQNEQMSSELSSVKEQVKRARTGEASVHQDNVTMSTKLNSLQSKYDDMLQKNNTLSENLQVAQRQAEDQRKAAERLDQQLDTTKADHKEQLKAEQQKIQRLEADLLKGKQEFTNTTTALREEITKIKTENAELRLQTSRTSDEREILLRKAQEKIEAGEEEISGLGRKCSALEDAVGAAQVKLNAYEKTQTILMEEKATTVAELQATKDELTLAEARSIHHLSRLNSLEAAYQVATLDLDSAKEVIHASSDENHKLLEKVKEQLFAAETSVKSLKEQLDDSEKQGASVKQDNQSLTDQLADAAKNMTSLEADKATLKQQHDQEIEALKEQLTNMDKDVVHTTEEMDTRQKAQETAVEELKADIKSKEQVITSLEKDLEETKQEVASANDALAKQKEETDVATKQRTSVDEEHNNAIEQLKKEHRDALDAAQASLEKAQVEACGWKTKLHEDVAAITAKREELEKELTASKQYADDNAALLARKEADWKQEQELAASERVARDAALVKSHQAALEEATTSATAANEKLLEATKAHKDEIDTLSAELATFKQDLPIKLAEVERLQSALDEATAQRSSVTETLDALRAKYEPLATQKAQLEGQRDALKEKLQERKEALKNANDMLDTAKTRLVDVQTELEVEKEKNNKPKHDASIDAEQFVERPPTPPPDLESVAKAYADQLLLTTSQEETIQELESKIVVLAKELAKAKATSGIPPPLSPEKKAYERKLRELEAQAEAHDAELADVKKELRMKSRLFDAANTEGVMLRKHITTMEENTVWSNLAALLDCENSVRRSIFLEESREGQDMLLAFATKGFNVPRTGVTTPPPSATKTHRGNQDVPASPVPPSTSGVAVNDSLNTGREPQQRVEEDEVLRTHPASLVAVSQQKELDMVPVKTIRGLRPQPEQSVSPAKKPAEKEPAPATAPTRPTRPGFNKGGVASRPTKTPPPSQSINRPPPPRLDDEDDGLDDIPDDDDDLDEENEKKLDAAVAAAGPLGQRGGAIDYETTKQPSPPHPSSGPPEEAIKSAQLRLLRNGARRPTSALARLSTMVEDTDGNLRYQDHAYPFITKKVFQYQYTPKGPAKAVVVETGTPLPPRPLSTSTSPIEFYTHQCQIHCTQVDQHVVAKLPLRADHLTILDVRCTNGAKCLGRVGIRPVLDLLYLCNNITKLDISSHRLSSDACELLYDIAVHHPSLSEIVMDGNLISGPGVVHLEHLARHNSNIQRVSLRNNSLLGSTTRQLTQTLEELCAANAGRR